METPSAPPWPSSPSPLQQEPWPPRQQPATRIPNRYDQEDDTVGSRLVDMTIKRLWRTSYTVLSVDLKRAAISYEGPPMLGGKRRPSSRQQPPRGTMVSATPGSYAVEEDENSSSSAGWAGRLQTSQAEARLKVMQVWDLSTKRLSRKLLDEEEESMDWRVNLGIGGVFQMDKGQLQPKLRLQAKHASLHLLPEPMLELRAKWPLGSTNMGLKLRCMLALNKLDKLVESPPRIMINLFKIGGPAVHFTPAGLLLDDNMLDLGKYTKIRVAAALEFPRELPVPEGEKAFKLDIRRVGLKARTL